MLRSIFQVEIHLAGHPLFIALGEQCGDESQARRSLLHQLKCCLQLGGVLLKALAVERVASGEVFVFAQNACCPLAEAGGSTRACSESPCQPSNGLLKGSAALQMLAIPTGMAVLCALQFPPIDHSCPTTTFRTGPGHQSDGGFFTVS